MSSTQYPKIQTLFERDDKFKVRQDAFRSAVYPLIREWEWTEKIDGTNIRLVWNCRDKEVFVAGRTDNAQIHPRLIESCRSGADVAKFCEMWPETDAVIYGEGYGAGIQKGGGAYATDKRFIAFDVFVIDSENLMGGWWLSPANARSACDTLGLRFVPSLWPEPMPLDIAVATVRGGISSIVAEGRRPMEGLVGRPAATLYDKRGARVICKLKTCDF